MVINVYHTIKSVIILTYSVIYTRNNSSKKETLKLT